MIFSPLAVSPPGFITPWLIRPLADSPLTLDDLPPFPSPCWIHLWFVIEACVSIYRKATSNRTGQQWTAINFFTYGPWRFVAVHCGPVAVISHTGQGRRWLYSYFEAAPAADVDTSYVSVEVLLQRIWLLPLTVTGTQGGSRTRTTKMPEIGANCFRMQLLNPSCHLDHCSRCKDNSLPASHV